MPDICASRRKTIDGDTLVNEPDSVWTTGVSPLLGLHRAPQ